MKKQIKEAQVHSSRVIENLWNLTEAVCLSVVAGFALYQAYTSVELNNIFAKALMFSGIVISLRAAQLFIKHLDK